MDNQNTDPTPKTAVEVLNEFLKEQRITMRYGHLPLLRMEQTPQGRELVFGEPQILVEFAPEDQQTTQVVENKEPETPTTE